MFYYLKTFWFVKMTVFELLEEEDLGFLTIVYHDSFNHKNGKLHLRFENFKENQLEIIDFIVKNMFILITDSKLQIYQMIQHQKKLLIG